MTKKFILVFMFFILSSFALGKSRVYCSDFATQAQAQRYYQQNNAYWLDRDGDGEACECLPGGSKYGSSRCRSRYR